jgi:hypothetical protein
VVGLAVSLGEPMVPHRIGFTPFDLPIGAHHANCNP